MLIQTSYLGRKTLNRKWIAPFSSKVCFWTKNIYLPFPLPKSHEKLMPSLSKNGGKNSTTGVYLFLRK